MKLPCFCNEQIQMTDVLDSTITVVADSCMDREASILWQSHWMVVYGLVSRFESRYRLSRDLSILLFIIHDVLEGVSSFAHIVVVVIGRVTRVWYVCLLYCFCWVPYVAFFYEDVLPDWHFLILWAQGQVVLCSYIDTVFVSFLWNEWFFTSGWCRSRANALWSICVGYVHFATNTERADVFCTKIVCPCRWSRRNGSSRVAGREVLWMCHGLYLNLDSTPVSLRLYSLQTL